MTRVGIGARFQNRGKRGDEGESDKDALFLSSCDTAQQSTDLICTFLQCRSVFFEWLLGTSQYPPRFRFHHDTTPVSHSATINNEV
jgi:hypothetical protein